MMNCRQILVCSIFLLVGVLWSLLLAIKGQMTSLTYSDLNSEEIQQSQIDSDEWPISSFSLETPLANQFPTLAEALEMVRLSAIVYTFRAKKDDSFCATYNVNHTRCHYYHHDRSLGTQVWIASNSKKRYLAVVFAGTDDLRTSLEDIDIAKKPFGNNGTVQLPKDLYSKVKIHAGFDNAVFTGAFDEVHTRLKRLQKEYPLYGRLYTTGHSLGAANSILMATGLAWLGERVVSINFGCPRVGNMAWRDFLGVGSSLDSRLAIWRVVLGWDLVPRLPDFFEHVGHTIQLWSEDHHKYDKRSPNVVECYYKHYGDETQGYVGVPSGWSSKPYMWLPGALFYHHIGRYKEYLNLLKGKDELWVDTFKFLQPIGYDDDIYDEPPDDWYAIDK